MHPEYERLDLACTASVGPDVTVTLPLPVTSSQGAATLPIVWPDGMAGASVGLQVWLLDPTGPLGLAATNGTRSRGA